MAPGSAPGRRANHRNLVSCCYECNIKKKDRPAEEFLRWLYRERRLDNPELNGRLRALDDLAARKLKPTLPGEERPQKRSNE